MPGTTHHRITRTTPCPQRLLATSSLIFFSLILSSGILQAQLPAGTTDTTQPQPQKQDPLLTQANEALDKHDYATAQKLLTTLTQKSPNDPHLLYDLASTQDALDQTSAAESTYRRAIAADPKYFDPHLALGLLLARSGKLPEAHTELLQATTLDTDNPALKARAYRALARIDQTANPAAASDELLKALKLSPETPNDILLSGELAEASGDPTAAEAAYRRLLAADPKNADATAALTHLLLHQQKPDQAETLLTAALAKDPDNPILNAQLASLYDKQGKTAQAIPSSKSSTPLTPKTALSPASSPASTPATSSTTRPIAYIPPSYPVPRRTPPSSTTPPTPSFTSRTTPKPKPSSSAP